MTTDPPQSRRDRAAVQVADVIMALVVLVPSMVLAPFWYKFIGMVTAEADPFSTVLLQLFVPIMFISLSVSVGVSARRRLS